MRSRIYKETGELRDGFTNEELKRIATRSKAAKRLLKDARQEAFIHAWKLKNAETNAFTLQYKAEVELGRRKALLCPAFKAGRTEGTYSLWFQCKARKRSGCFIGSNYSPEKLFRNFCKTCRLTPEKARTKMVFEKIAGGS